MEACRWLCSCRHNTPNPLGLRNARTLARREVHYLADRFAGYLRDV
jgi:hypothetical protein